MNLSLVSQMLLVLFSFNAFAGIRIIHGGGGYAEMQALTLFARLDKYARACAQNPEICDLSPSQAELLTEAWRTDSLSKSGARVEFFSPTVDDINQIYLPSALLYKGQDEPRALAEIGAQVFAAWMRQPRIQSELGTRFQLDHRALLDLGLKVFSHLEVQTESVAIGHFRLAVSALHFKIAGSSEVILALEGQSASRDITDKVLAELPCSGPEDRRLIRIRGLHGVDGIFSGRATWLCGERE